MHEKDEALKRVLSDMEKMKKITKNLIDNTKSGDTITPNCVSSIGLENDQGYFNSYSHFGIHHEMLSVNIFLIKI